MNNENNGDFFVILSTEKGGYTPLMSFTGSHEEELAKFGTKEEARGGALSTALGKLFGYEIFRLDMGKGK